MKRISEKINKFGVFLILCFICFFNESYAQKKTIDDKFYLLEEYIVKNPKYVLAVLDSIKNDAEIKGYTIDETYFYSLKGQAYFTLCDYDQAYKNYNKALQVLELNESVDLLHQADVLILLGDFFLDIEKYQKSEEYYKLALKNFIALNDSNGVLEIKQNIAILYQSQENYIQSNKILLDEENNFELSSDISLKIVGCYEIACNFLCLDNKIKANEYIGKFNAIEIIDTSIYNLVDYNYFAASLNFKISEYFVDKNSLDSAILYLSKLNHSFVINDLQNRQSYFELWMDIYTKKGNFDYYQIYKDSLLILKNTLSNIKIYNNINLNNNIDKMEEVLLAEKNAKRFNKQISYIISFLFLCLLLIVFTKRKKILKTLKLRREQIIDLTFKVKQQNKISFKLIEKDKIINEIKVELKQIFKIKDNDGQKKRINELLNKINININNKDFDASFEQISLVNPDFFKKINLKYPVLSELEQLICFYIYMDFKNFEISKILNTTTRSVESKRYRIRKKIKIEIKHNDLKEIIKDIVDL